jgi:DICT domain-containing protein
VRLDVAIRQVLEQSDAVARPAVFSRVADRHPAQPRRPLRKATLVRLCHAVEDEVSTHAQQAHLFASFQSKRHFRPARDRWTELSRLAASAHVFADFGDAAAVEGQDGPGPVRVNLPERAPLRREWALVCDVPELPVAMLAWEPPAQVAGADGDRVLDVMWSVDPLVVRDAARSCAEAAAAAGSTRAAELVAGPLAGDPPERPDPRSPLALDRMMLRILGGLDDSSARPRGR